MPRARSRVCSLAIAVLISPLCGCVSMQDQPARPDVARIATTDGYSITAQELDQLTNSFADTYVSRLVSACDAAAAEAQTPEVRADIQYFKLGGAVSVYDIATEIDPYAQLLDLVTMVTLQHIVWVQEGQALQRLGPPSEHIIAAIERSREELHHLSLRVLKPEQLAVLEDQAHQWRERNRDISIVALVRFNDAASERARDLLADVPKGSGLLAPVSQAVDSLERSRKLAERGFFLAKRLHLIIGWQADDTVNRFFAKREVRDSLEILKHGAASLDRAVVELDQLPANFAAERQKIFSELEAREKALDQTLARLESSLSSGARMVDGINDPNGSIKQLLNQVEQTSTSLEQTLAGVDRLLVRLDQLGLLTGKASDDAAAGPKKYDLDDYAVVAERLTKGAQELNQLVHASGDLLASEAWTKRLSEIDQLTKDRVEHAKRGTQELTDYIFARGVMLIAIALAAAVAYRMVAIALTRRLTRKFSGT